MADTYTDTLGLIAQEEGTHSNEWGDLLNLNFQRLDSATRGYINIVLSGAQSLDANDITTTGSTAQEESFFKFIEFTGTGGTVTVPAENIMWIVYNNTGGDFTFQPSGGTGVTLTDGQVHFIVYGSNGTTFTDVTSLLALTNATTVTAADESADTTCFPLFVTAATGDVAPKTGTNLTFNSSTGDLGITSLTTTGDAVIGGEAQLEAFSEDADQYTATTGTRDLDVSLATYFYPSADLGTAVITFTFSNPAASGRVSSFTLELLGADGATLTWPTSVDWSNGAEPAWSAGVDIVSFVTRDGGTTWLGFLGGLDFS